MSNVDERKFLLEVIEVYSSLPALWDNKSTDYSNRTKKNEQYDQLLQKYNERYPEADRKALVKKINSLRTNFRKELRRIKNSERSGAGTDEIVEPTLWYFEEMKFLSDLEEPTESISTMSVEEESGENEINTSLVSNIFLFPNCITQVCLQLVTSSLLMATLCP
jgi:hypothetical protein